MLICGYFYVSTDLSRFAVLFGLKLTLLSSFLAVSAAYDKVEALQLMDGLDFVFFWKDFLLVR